MQRRKIEEVQLLRAAAAIAVVLSHAISRAERGFADLWSVSWLANIGDLHRVGHCGVDLFFCISGFVMIYAHHQDFQKPGASARFLYRRLTRVAPIYWILTWAGVALLSVAPALFTYRDNVDWRWVFCSLSFIPIESIDGVRSPVLGLGWTLNYEVYFYALFALALTLPRRTAFVALAAFFSASIAAGWLLEPVSLSGQQVTSWLLIEFLMGVGIGLLLLSHEQTLRTRGPAALVIGTMLLILSSFSPPAEDDKLMRFCLWGLPSALILAGALGSDWSRLPGFRLGGLLGRASYSIYLVQVFALPASVIMLKKTHLAGVLPIEGLVAAMVLVSVVSSVVFWALVERPLTNLLHGKFSLRFRRATLQPQKVGTG